VDGSSYADWKVAVFENFCGFSNRRWMFLDFGGIRVMIRHCTVEKTVMGRIWGKRGDQLVQASVSC